MPAPGLNDLISIKDVLSSTRDSKTGSILYNIGNALDSSSAVTNGAEVWQTPGLISIPSEIGSSKADKTKVPQAICLTRGDRDIVIAQKDIRTQTLAGSLSPGDTCLYAGGRDATGQPRILLKGTDNSINLYTKKDNDSGGTGLGLFINGNDDSITITNSKGFGIIINEDGIKIFTKNGSVIIGDAVNISSTGQVQLDGTNIVLGSNVVPLVNAPLCGPVYLSSKPSQKVLIE